MHLIWTRICAYRLYRPMHDACVCCVEKSIVKSIEMFGAHGKFFESFWNHSRNHIHIYPSSLSARNPRVMDLLSLPMEVPMPRIPWMAINHHDIMRPGRVLGHSNGGISKSFLVHLGMRK